MSALGGLEREKKSPCSSWGAGPRPIQAGWAAMRENTAARLDRTARLRDYLLVSREKRLNPRYLPGCQTSCRNAGERRAAYPCLGYEQRR